MRLRSQALLLASLLTLVFLLLSGCSKTQQTTSGSGPGVPSKPKIRAAVVTDVGGVGDMSFNAMAWEGLQRAGKGLNIEAKLVESKEQADYVTNLSKLADQGYDLVFAIGFLMEDAVKQVAPKYPKVKFAIVDGNAPTVANAVSLKFREEEGCFLAGALGGGVSKTGKIGFIGGMDVPLIRKFEAGYTAGAKTMRPDIKVMAAYTGKFDDPGKGKELALTQFSQGADIIFHASGSCGLGVIDAAKSKGPGFYAIGVDADQDGIAQGSVLTSMMKRVDNAVYSTCKSVVAGKFQPGEQLFGLKDSGIGLSPMRYTKQDVSPEVSAKIEKLKQLIIEGKLMPPKTAKEVSTFVAPKL